MENQSAPTTQAITFADIYMLFPQGVRKPVAALNGFTLSVETGAVVGLLGPNGSGKTTALSCLLGLLTPHSGTVKLFGEEVRGTPLEKFPYGILLEDTRLPQKLTVQNALGYACSLRGMNKRESKRRIEEVVTLLDISQLLFRRISKLSKGQARKVGLAAALVADPPLLILDEPSSGMDVHARKEFDQLLLKIRDGKRTVLFTSHFLSDLENSCTHVAIIQEGKVILSGETKELLTAVNAEPQSSVFVHQLKAEKLRQIGIRYIESCYANLVLLEHTLSDQGILMQLLAHDITPARMEPKKSLISLYLTVTRNEESA